jgi:Flp pilus assembly protein TadD
LIWGTFRPAATLGYSSAITLVSARATIRTRHTGQLRCDSCACPANAPGVRTQQKQVLLHPSFFAFSLVFSVLFLLVFGPVMIAQTPIKTLKPLPPAPSAPQTRTELGKEPDATLAEAKSLVDQGLAGEAESAVRQYLDKHADSADAHFLLGYILFREIQGNAGAAAGETIATDSANIARGSDTGMRETKAKASLAEYTEGAKYHSPSALDLKTVALDYVLLGDYPDADKWLTRSLDWNPKDSEGWYYLGRTKYNENRFAEAIKAFDECLKLDPRNVKAEDNLGLSYAGLGRNEEATTAYQTAIRWQAQLLIKNPGPYIDLGNLLLDENRPAEAISNFVLALEISPRDSKAHELLARAYAHSDQLQKAQSEMEKALELDPESGPLHCMLAQIYKREQMKEKAKNEFERCAAIQGTHSSPEVPRP